MKDILDPAVIAELRALSTPDDDLLAEVAEIFLTEAPRRVAEIESAHRSGDPDTLWRSAHELRSVASNIGAAPIRELCDILQERGRAGTVDGLESVMDQLRTLLLEAQAAAERISH